MRTPASRFGFRLLAALLFCFPSVFSQTNGPPADPHEMVTHEPRTLSKSADRSAAIDLLNHARQNFNLHDIHSCLLYTSCDSSLSQKSFENFEAGFDGASGAVFASEQAQQNFGVQILAHFVDDADILQQGLRFVSG